MNKEELMNDDEFMKSQEKYYGKIINNCNTDTAEIETHLESIASEMYRHNEILSEIAKAIIK